MPVLCDFRSKSGSFYIPFWCERISGKDSVALVKLATGYSTQTLKTELLVIELYECLHRLSLWVLLEECLLRKAV